MGDRNLQHRTCKHARGFRQRRRDGDDLAELGIVMPCLSPVARSAVRLPNVPTSITSDAGNGGGASVNGSGSRDRSCEMSNRTTS